MKKVFSVYAAIISPAVVVAVLFAMLQWACGPQNPNLTPQANVARYAGDVVASMRVIQQTIAKAPLPEATIATAMNRFLQAEKYALQLGDALKAYDTAANLTNKDSAAATVEAVLVNLNTILFDIGAPLVNVNVQPETRTQIERLINNVQGLIFQIRSAIPQLRPTPVAAIERMQHGNESTATAEHHGIDRGREQRDRIQSDNDSTGVGGVSVVAQSMAKTKSGRDVRTVSRVSRDRGHGHGRFFAEVVRG